jgi:hypothetical protein
MSSSIKQFFDARAETFSRNIDAAQRQAQTLTRNVAAGHFPRTDTFENNIYFLQEQAKIFTRNRAETFSNNIEFAQEKAAVYKDSLIENIQGENAPRTAGEFIQARAKTFASNVDFLTRKRVLTFSRNVEYICKRQRTDDYDFVDTGPGSDDRLMENDDYNEGSWI